MQDVDAACGRVLCPHMWFVDTVSGVLQGMAALLTCQPMQHGFRVDCGLILGGCLPACLFVYVVMLSCVALSVGAWVELISNRNFGLQQQLGCNWGAAGLQV
jgi:hypothetical protein